MMDDLLVTFIHDDITWCASECNNKECFRHTSNMTNKDGIHSFADFKGTYDCPMKEGKT